LSFYRLLTSSPKKALPNRLWLSRLKNGKSGKSCSLETELLLPEYPIFSHFQITPLLAKEAAPIVNLSPDLGRSVVRVVRVHSGWALPDGNILTEVQLNTIHNDQNSCFRFVDGRLEKIQTISQRTNRYYSLMPTAGAPTILISGIPMHRVKGTTPDKDTRQKIKALGKPYGLILDTATGLGYTAIMAAQSADQVITVEFDPAVHLICRCNPWSTELFTRDNIQPLIGNSADLVATLDDETFSAVIHDPPTFALAGEMYALETYRHLYRILKSGGRLFHYIGNPTSRYGATTSRGVVARLSQVGFTVKPKPHAFGVLAIK
jgi:predicted methyltransferase